VPAELAESSAEMSASSTELICWDRAAPSGPPAAAPLLRRPFFSASNRILCSRSLDRRVGRSAASPVRASRSISRIYKRERGGEDRERPVETPPCLFGCSCSLVKLPWDKSQCLSLCTCHTQSCHRTELQLPVRSMSMLKSERPPDPGFEGFEVRNAGLAVPEHQPWQSRFVSLPRLL